MREQRKTYLLLACGTALRVSDVVPIPFAIQARMTDKSTELSKQRKKKEISPQLATEEDLKAFKEKSSYPVHLANPVTSLDVHLTNPDVMLTGGGDGKVVLFDIAKGKATAKMEGHSKRIIRTVLHPTQPLAFSASADKTVRMWRAEDGKCSNTWKNHTNDVTGLTLHATGEYLVSASADCTWAFHDIATGKCRQVVQGKAGDAGYSVASFHPDGLLLGTGKADGTIAMWDVKSQQAALSFGAHSGTVPSLCFSENGYYLATCGKDGAKVWDLRKVAKQVCTPTSRYEVITMCTAVYVCRASSTLLTCTGPIAIGLYHLDYSHR